jgi:F-type H+-transporting ATPase subunit a
LDPLHQFQIQPVFKLAFGGIDLSYSNSALSMTVVVGLVIFVMLFGTRRRLMVPSRLQSVAELLYEFVAKTVRENTGPEGAPFVPFVFTIFIFILFGNLLGMVPGFFTFTSHIIVTAAMAIMVFVFVTLLAFVKHGLHFFSFFAPHGTPGWLMPLMVPIEVISYFVRPVALSVRLFANMMAGHTMMKVFASFTVMAIMALGEVGGLLVGLMPVALNVALTGLEILVACLQAYVFTVLTCLYLRDALHLH